MKNRKQKVQAEDEVEEEEGEEGEGEEEEGKYQEWFQLLMASMQKNIEH